MLFGRNKWRYPRAKSIFGKFSNIHFICHSFQPESSYHAGKFIFHENFFLSSGAPYVGKFSWKTHFALWWPNRSCWKAGIGYVGSLKAYLDLSISAFYAFSVIFPNKAVKWSDGQISPKFTFFRFYSLWCIFWYANVLLTPYKVAIAHLVDMGTLTLNIVFKVISMKICQNCAKNDILQLIMPILICKCITDPL